MMHHTLLQHRPDGVWSIEYGNPNLNLVEDQAIRYMRGGVTSENLNVIHSSKFSEVWKDVERINRGHNYRKSRYHYTSYPWINRVVP